MFRKFHINPIYSLGDMDKTRVLVGIPIAADPIEVQH